MLLDRRGQLLTSATGLPLALNPAGGPLLGPDGCPVSLAPDGKALLSWQGRPLLGPQVGSTWCFEWYVLYVEADRERERDAGSPALLSWQSCTAELAVLHCLSC